MAQKIAWQWFSSKYTLLPLRNMCVIHSCKWEVLTENNACLLIQTHYFIIQLQIPTLHLMEMLSNSASNASCLNNFSEIVDWISHFTIFSNFNAFKQQICRIWIWDFFLHFTISKMIVRSISICVCFLTFQWNEIEFSQ